jgi:hypothetical protein
MTITAHIPPRPANADEIPPLAKNEVMGTAKGTRIENLQPARLWREHVYMLESFRIIFWAKLAVRRQV